MRLNTITVRMLVFATLAAAASAAGAQTPTYKKHIPAALAAKAKVAEPAAAATALAKVPGGKIESSELEEEHGKLVYSYDIKVAGKSGIEEIQVDAVTGAVVSVEHETPAAMKEEAAQDAKQAKQAKAPKAPKKP